jgi:hypothetical protein
MTGGLSEAKESDNYLTKIGLEKIQGLNLPADFKNASTR